jgi:hypothetical protein
LISEKFSKILDPTNLLVFDDFQGELDKLESQLFAILIEKEIQKVEKIQKEIPKVVQKKKKIQKSDDPDESIFHSDSDSDMDSMQSLDLDEDELEYSKIKPPKFFIHFSTCLGMLKKYWNIFLVVKMTPMKLKN